MNLLIVGAPGVGKGTMSQLIIDNYDVVHVSTGDMLRSAIADQTSVGLQAAEYMNAGKLVPDSIIHDIIVERLSKDDIKKGFLFDGYPRTLSQAIDLSKILEQLNMKIDAVIDLKLDDEIIAKRITGRRTCPDCGAIYNIYFNPSKVENVCDNCGGNLSTRKDDNLSSLKIRLDEFYKNTRPVIDYYKQEASVYEINADQKLDDEFADIQKILEGMK